eukprot:7497918-Lingulodinium_polyedra.AAC.1
MEEPHTWQLLMSGPWAYLAASTTAPVWASSLSWNLKVVMNGQRVLLKKSNGEETDLLDYQNEHVMKQVELPSFQQLKAAVFPYSYEGAKVFWEYRIIQKLIHITTEEAKLSTRQHQLWDRMLGYSLELKIPEKHSKLARPTGQGRP